MFSIVLTKFFFHTEKYLNTNIRFVLIYSYNHVNKVLISVFESNRIKIIRFNVYRFQIISIKGNINLKN